MVEFPFPFFIEGLLYTVDAKKSFYFVYCKYITDPSKFVLMLFPFFKGLMYR